MLRNVFLKSLRDRRRSMIWWTLGLGALGQQGIEGQLGPQQVHDFALGPRDRDNLGRDLAILVARDLMAGSRAA